MVAAAQKLDDFAPQQTENPQESAPVKQKKPYLRQEGESMLWFNRFSRYRKLGPKRTILAALEQERSEIKALKSTEKPQSKAGAKLTKPVRKSHLTEVPQPKSVQVPGSWKQASIRWNWVERARAWDQHCIDTLVEHSLEEVLSGLSTGLMRIRMLKSLAEYLAKGFEVNHNRMNYTEECMYIARTQSVLKDIREEMGDLDESVARLAQERETRQVYMKLEPQEYLEVMVRGEQKKNTNKSDSPTRV